jgi:starvation-inducible DNA-binding protein
MEQLIEQMKVVLASTFSLYLKAHGYHWNVTGPNFSEYHSFFGDFYEGVHDSVDPIAEHIRALGAYAPASLMRFTELTSVQDESSIPQALVMIARLSLDNAKVLDEYRKAHKLASSLSQYGLINFIEGQIDWHEKMAWQLKAFAG